MEIEVISMTGLSLIVFVITFGIGKVYLHLRYNYRQNIKEKQKHLRELSHNVK